MTRRRVDRSKAETEDTALVLAWRRGDARARDTLLARYRAKLERYLCKRCPEAAEDLVHETLVACIEGISRLRDPRRFRAYAYATARRKLDRCRDEHARSRLFDMSMLEQDLVSDDRTELACEVNLLTSRVEDLDPAQVDVLRLYYVHGLRAREIAARLSIPEATVRSRLRRGLDRLRPDARRRTAVSAAAV